MTLTVESFLSNAGKTACSDGAAFARKYQTMQEVWTNCTNPQWMFWILERTRLLDEITQRRLACAFVRQPEVWKLLTDERSRHAVEVAEKFCDGHATSDELTSASASASASTYAASTYAASAYAASAAASASASTYAASASAYAAAASAASAYQCTEIRKLVPDIDVWIAGVTP